MRVATERSKVEQVIRQIESLLEENNMSLDCIGNRIVALARTESEDKEYVLYDVESGETISELPRRMDTERFVVIEDYIYEG